MKRFYTVFFFILLGMSLFLGSWYVIHNDIEFTSEIARDFFLLDELHKKGIVLIGPSSTTGLFHGPLWTYLNFPAYSLGHGNPVIVGWYWIFLSSLFVISGYIIAKKLFDKPTAYLYTLMIALYTVFHVRGMYNPHGAMLVLPAVFFFFIRYLQTKQAKFLVGHVLLLGALIQFQMAIGIPFAILSFASVLLHSILWKRFFHPLFFLLLIACLGNFIIFDVRHQFLLSHLVFHFITSASRDHPNLFSMLLQRFQYLTTSVEFFRSNEGYRNILASAIFIFFLIAQFRYKKYTLIYQTFLYFYIGFFILSNLNAGGLLYFYVFPLFPFVFLPFASFVTSRFSKIFIVIFFIIYAVNMLNAVSDMQIASASLIGKANTSWLFFAHASSTIFSGPENQLGYFVYSPDVVGYKEKYAMLYAQRNSSKKVTYFQKKNITYLFIAPPPSNNPYMGDNWWVVNMLHLSSTPIKIVHFPNGYNIEKYQLSPLETEVPTESNIDPGISFR